MLRPYIYISFLTFLLAGCTSTKTHIVDLDYQRVDLESGLEADPSIEQIVAPYKLTLGNEMDEVIAQNEKGLKKQKPNSSLGNWFADVLHKASSELLNEEVDFAAQNYGGIRIPTLPSGPVTVGKIYELMPFDNMLIIVEADGETTKKLIDRIADYGGWPISSGLSFSLDENRKATDILIKGQALDINKTYKIALPDYIANGGDECEFLNSQKQKNSGVFVRDAIINYLKTFPSDRKIIVDPTKRITTN